ncbi:hypothetical protein [Symbiobacterium thermophilum]|uniref:hypothetical protein n=1 Tax=Symbiobacterium thermophilum TaxID=2734 RepID=UPI000324FBF9|nr:hypothetical protein [Symbiobacterium thermophilum]
MGGHPRQPVSERELRSLDLKEFLALVEADIRELDRRQLARHRLPSLPLRPVSCCGKRLGAFPPSARVRCPFCGTWIAPGEDPRPADPSAR